jgi:diaminohydroxyphosphoribosylaminopyrimidine deaminase/5-amino-6-(5-phosphoribosylamino)uracil reductase
MGRALEWAQRGRWGAAPNPMVGCVIVSASGRLLGEGFHQRPGEPHAEIAALNQVASGDRGEIPGSTLYVTLEPCAHHGRTPPCADRLVAERVGRVVVSLLDPFPAVAGRGLERLRKAGIAVEVGLGAEEAAFQNRRFLHVQRTGRPYVVLKWAQSADGFMDPRSGAQPGAGMVALTAPASRRVSHAWRSWEGGILVGGKTAAIDRPRLDVRDAPGPSPIRFVLDPSGNHLSDADVRANLAPFWHIHQPDTPVAPGAESLPWTPDEGLPELLQRIQATTGVLSLLIEGGPTTLSAFIEAGIWDEIRILTAPKYLGSGLQAPPLPSPLPAPYRTGRAGTDAWQCILAPHQPPPPCGSTSC